jgi:large repetitive protein
VPLGFLSDPAGYFTSPAGFGAPGGFSPAKAAAFVDALKPLLNLSGGPGEIQLAAGAALSVSGASGALRLAITLDNSPFASPAGDPPRLAFGGAFTLELPGSGSPRPTVDLFVGLPGAATGRQAAHLVVGDGVRLFLRPATGSDISLFPDPPGLGSLAGAALQALPFALDQVAAIAAPPAGLTAARVVTALGDALDLRTAGHFDAAKLSAWSANPAQRFADRLPILAQAALTDLAAAVGPALPTGLSIVASPNLLTLTAGPVGIAFGTAPFSVAIEASVAGVPFAGNVAASIAFDASGLRSFTGTAGPATIPVNGAALHPFIGFAAGPSPQNGPRFEVGSATDAAGATGVLARWVFTGGGFSLVARDGGSETSDPEHVALALARMALDIVARFAFEEAAVQTLLEKPIPHAAAANAKVKSLLQGVFLQDGVEPPALDPALFDPAQLLGRFMRLLRNVAQAGATVPVADGLSVGARLDANIVKLTLGVNGRIDLPTGDVKVSIEADSRWIVGAPAAGLAIGFVDLSGSAPVFAPSLSVDGIGLRIGKASGPLLDSAVKLGSVAAHFYADISPAGLAGGVQLELSDLAVGASGAGGNNAVAQGVVGDTGSGGNALAPAFSPALAVQKHQGGPVLVSLRAGEGDGPWWLSIQKGFGPLYVEQVGFGVTVRQDQLEKISVLFDGRISIAGLVAAVDDLQITFTVTSGASLFDASRWAVDLGGLAVNADISGVTLAGGLRKFGGDADHPDVEYIGMLMARVATYGLSIYGGYGTGVSDGVRFTAFFAFGAVTGPFGGPPAFFLTGVGGGFGINRDLVFPSSLADFANFVMIQALDPSASPSSDPMEALQQIRDTFPMRRDRFWFAAGVSFTCFALVDGVAVVALSFGGGFELTLLGLARMALPRPQLRLVSIELGLMVRFSTRDGVLWIQAELTENSWLLHESVRLTGGFAYVMWFAGDHSGEFVLTLGGYHPSFHRDGYPDVPRLGFRWQATPFISIKGGSYFALTSEALMAGGALEASATLGPAWASISFEANVIIYFDPFRYEGDAQARVAAGVTIDLWLGEVTISVHLSARIDVAGPDFHGSATFEVGPIGLTVRFGGSDQSGWEPISWEAFVNKYLEAESPGVARTLTSITGRGSIPPGAGANGDEKGTADGSTEKPFEVFSEFELTVTTTAPATRLVAGGQTRDVAPSGLLGVAPVNAGSMSSVVTLTLRPAGGGADVIGGLRLASTSLGSFPVGAWGPAQSREDKKIPQGEVIDALNGALFVAEAKLEGTIPEEVDYNQVEAGPRHPLPFVTEAADRARVLAGAKKLVDLLPANPTADEIYAKASPWLAEGGARPLALASLRGGRAAPPRLGALGDRMATQTPTAAIALAVADPPKTVDRAVKAPRAIGILHPLARPEAKARRTTVKDDLPRVLPPTMAEADAMVAAGLAAKLVRVAPVAGVAKRTLIAQRSIPLTRQARMAPAASNARGTDSVALSRLKGLSAGLGGSRASSADRVVRPGEVAILSMPNARRDSGADPRPTLKFKGPARVTMFGAGGGILSDVVGDSGAPQIPQGAERIAVWASPVDPTTAMLGLAGWNAAQSLAYVGWATCLCGGGSVYSEGGRIRRGPESFTTGWIAAREFLAGSRIITTRFTKPAATLVVVIDEAVGDSADFSLSVRGAAIASDPTGAEAAPVLLSQGSRRILIYALAAGPADFAVEILRDGGVQVSGVMASPASPAVTAARLTEQSAEALVDGLAGPDGEVALKFVHGKR